MRPLRSPFLAMWIIYHQVQSVYASDVQSRVSATAPENANYCKLAVQGGHSRK